MAQIPNNRQVSVLSDNPPFPPSTPTNVLVKRVLTCRRLRECGSPYPPGQELVTVRRVGGLDAVRREIASRETIGGAR